MSKKNDEIVDSVMSILADGKNSDSGLLLIIKTKDGINTSSVNISSTETLGILAKMKYHILNSDFKKEKPTPPKDSITIKPTNDPNYSEKTVIKGNKKDVYLIPTPKET